MNKEYEVLVAREQLQLVWQQQRPAFERELGAFRRMMLTMVQPYAEKLPATSGLMKAYIERLEDRMSIADRGTDWSKISELDEEIMELRSYVVSGIPELQQGRDLRLGLDKHGDILVNSGFTFTEARNLNEAMEPKKGAPATDRQGVYLTACDMRWAGRKWTDITKQLCEDKAHGQPAHNESCRDKFKKGVSRVEKLLKKYGTYPSGN